MRILHATDTFLPRLGGIEVLVDDLAAHQRRAGHQVQVLTGTPPGAGLDCGHDVGHDCEQGCDQDCDQDAERGTVRLSGPLVADVGEVIRRYRPDVVHCHSSIVSPLAWRTARSAARAGLPVLVSMHSIAPSAPALRAAIRQFARLIPGSVAWTAVSSTAAATLAPLVGSDVRVLPNGIDRRACHPARPGSHDLPLIVSVMRLCRRKRPLGLIDVLAGVRSEVGDLPWQALIVGDGPQEASVLRAIRRAGLAGNVHLTGRLSRPQIADLLARADVYLAPAHLESFGLAALEARCSGVPVVAMRSGGVGEFVQDAVNGYLVADDDEMAYRTADLITRPDRLRELGRRSRADPPNLDWENVVQRTLEAYDWATASRWPNRRDQHAPTELEHQ